MAATIGPMAVLRALPSPPVDRSQERGRWRRAAALSLLLHLVAGSFVWLLSLLAEPPPGSMVPIRITLLFEGAPGGDGEQGGGVSGAGAGGAAASRGEAPPLPE